MPKWRRPGLSNRGIARGEAGDKRTEAIAVDNLTLRLCRDCLEVLAIRFEPREFVGRGLSDPAASRSPTVLPSGAEAAATTR
jgi:hypothetical protein